MIQITPNACDTRITVFSETNRRDPRLQGVSSIFPIRVNQCRSRSILIPLPPLAEPHRIVAKVDQLMALCNLLKAAIAAAQTKQTDRLNAVMAQG